MMRGRMEDIHLEAGDVLLVLGPRERVTELRFSREVLLIEWSTHELPSHRRAKAALAIFAGVVAIAATGIVPIALAALMGAVGMIGVGCLNIRQGPPAPWTGRWPCWSPRPWPWAQRCRPRVVRPIWHSI